MSPSSKYTLIKSSALTGDPFVKGEAEAEGPFRKAPSEGESESLALAAARARGVPMFCGDVLRKL